MITMTKIFDEINELPENCSNECLIGKIKENIDKIIEELEKEHSSTWTEICAIQSIKDRLK